MDAMAALLEHGMLLQSARGPIPNVAEMIAGEPIVGSWWGHPEKHRIFAALNELDASPDVVRLRLVAGKLTFVHRRLWPVVVRLADRFPPKALAAVEEVHTTSGTHRTTEVRFPAWVPDAVLAAAAELSEEEALSQLAPGVLPTR